MANQKRCYIWRFKFPENEKCPCFQRSRGNPAFLWLGFSSRARNSPESPQYLADFERLNFFEETTHKKILMWKISLKFSRSKT
jgi:hypothetical protein